MSSTPTEDPGQWAQKLADIVSPDTAASRENVRVGLRELDAMTESMLGLRRQQRDRERISPRATTAELGHPGMQRPLPSADQERTLLSRQKKA